MAISKIGGTGSDNWELISSVTPTAASAAVNLTGLTPYRKLMIKLDAVELNTSGTIAIRMNADSGTNNYHMGQFATAGNQFFYDKSGFLIATGTTTGPYYGSMMFSSCDNTGPKILEMAPITNNSSSLANAVGVYWATAIVTQVNVITTTTFKALGTVALYGVK